MNPLTRACTAFFVLLTATIAVGADKTAHTYQPGTITGWSTRHYEVTGAATGRSIPAHKQVYDLKGAEAVYEIDDCGFFGVGHFEAGQAVDYRVDGKRIYIRRDDGKEYKCKMEGVKTDASSTPH